MRKRIKTLMLKNIIFDLGGVLLTIDYALTEKAFNKLGYDRFHEMYSQLTADDLFQQLETGKVSEKDFYRKLLALSEKELKEQHIEEAWNSMLLTWRKKSLDFLETLRGKYRLFLLSNTNSIHISAFNKLLKAQTGRDSINPLFEKAYYSNEIGLRKPGAEIYLFVSKDAGIGPAETLFIDDTPANIETAAALGFRTYLLKEGEKIEDLDFDTLSQN